MKKLITKRRKLGGLFALTMGFMAVVSAGIASNFYFKNTNYASAEIFHNPNGVTVQKNLKAEAPGLADDRKGVKISSSVSGSSITIADEMRGLFELNFRAYSPTAYVQSNPFYGDKVTNYSVTLNTMSLIFTDTTDSSKTFRLGIEGASQQNFATPQAYVEAGGLRGGIYTHPEDFASTVETRPNPDSWDRSAPYEYGNTTGANAKGRYTALWRTSFSNVGYTASQTWHGGDTKLSAPDSNYIVFDPVSMRVSAKSTADGEEKLIWDLSQEYNDGKQGVVFESFESYNVTLEFTDIVSKSTADVIVYSLNGQSLAGETYENNAGASVFADFSKQAVKNTKYVLPAPSYYDVLSNSVKNTEVSVMLGENKLDVYSADGKPVTTYSAGCYVIPKMKGTMSVKYTAKDVDGFAGLPLTAKVSVLDGVPTTAYTLYGRMEQGELGVGSVITIPAGTAVNPITKKAPALYVSVKKNGQTVGGFDNRLASVGLPLTLNEKGEYLIEYKAEGLDDVLTYVITAVDTLPAFNLEEMIPEESRVGVNIVIPSATAVFGGESKAATTKVYFPDGGLYTANSVFFEQAGKYTIEYSAEFNGELYTKAYEINVADNQATFTGGSISSVITPAASSARYDAIKGVRIDSSASTDVFTYSKKIDLSNSTKDDLLIEIFNSAPWGENLGEGLTVTITDAYDPTNKITIEGRYYWFYNTLWLKAAATGQPLRAWATLGEGAAGSYLCDSTSPYGTAADYNTYTFLGETRAYELYLADYSDLGLKLFYDNEEKAIYTQNNQAKRRIIGFDEKYQAKPWKGFTTGEVYLSITKFKSVVVSKVYNNDLSDDKVFGGHSEIFVDTQNFDEKNLPNAVAGKPYPIFDAYAINSVEGRKTDISVSVFRNYGHPSFLEYEVVDGQFTPELPGVYTIVYSLRDAFHNETIKKIRVTAVAEKEVDPVYLTVDTGETNMFVGEYYTLPEIQSFGGGIGELKKLITVTNEQGVVQPIENNVFYASASGKYTIAYKVSDFIGNGEPNESVVYKTVYANVQETPILYDPLLPEFVISGMDLKLPAVEAIDFKSDVKGVAPKSTSITATIDGKSVDISADNICRPEIEAGQKKTMTLTYSAENTYGTTEKSYTITVVNPGTSRGYLWEYFQPISGSFVKSEFATSGAEYHDLTLTSSDDNAAVQFINPVLAHGFEFKVSAMNSNVDKITVTLFDSENMNVSVRFDIIKNLIETQSNSISSFSINGGALVDCAGNFYSAAAGLGFAYSQNTFEVTDNNGGALGAITKTEKGEPFNGFPSGKVWVKIAYGDVDGSFEMRINKLGGQAISDRSMSSRSDPAYHCTGFLPLQCETGGVVTLPVMIAQSTITPRTTVTVRVLRLNEEGLEDGELLPAHPISSPIQVILPEYGNYRVVYEISDGNGRSVSVDYTIYTIESEPPELTISGKMPQKVKVGQKVTVPKGIAVDNASKNPIVRIYVIMPNRDMHILGEDRTFVADQAGQYVIRYYAYDDSYNYTVQNYVIIAE